MLYITCITLRFLFYLFLSLPFSLSKFLINIANLLQILIFNNLNYKNILCILILFVVLLLFISTVLVAKVILRKTLLYVTNFHRL